MKVNFNSLTHSMLFLHFLHAATLNNNRPERLGIHRITILGKCQIFGTQVSRILTIKPNTEYLARQIVTVWPNIPIFQSLKVLKS